MNGKQNKSFTKILPQIENLINSKPSRVLPRGWSPAQIQKDERKARLVLKFEERKIPLAKRFSFNLNQPVRVQIRAHDNPLARKAYKGVFSKEIFRIDRRFATRPNTYSITDSSGYKLTERVYSPELQLVEL